jgi:hypothetical protein
MKPKAPCAAPQTITLCVDEVLSFPKGLLTIACMSGAVWITDGMGHDRVVRAGQETWVRSKSKVCLQALMPSQVGIQRQETLTRLLPFPASAAT